ncbi:hypothetical protein EV207_101205 [Scopulibacillus darangshiensis]|uniref:Uncharacterized protein n=1 Tax=Scopulibacillus darangshiensis TaxID=442528 RepID=A0A4R2PB72_9BACL|nr:hypothetical protein [Scopulibacillus darangshiensis]TCP32227.1 hypothetical protein EV207_101205 [Scopulibacillus darangshiensis]
MNQEGRNQIHQRYHQLYMDTGAFHRQTVQNTPWDSAFHDQMYQHYLQELISEQQFFEQFTEQAEHRVYPSPFEQFFLETLSHLMNNYQEAKNNLDRWKSESKNEERIVYTFQNGNSGSRGGGVTHPSRELALVMQQTGYDLPLDSQEWRRFFDDYESAFPLTTHELVLLGSFLYRPRQLYNILHRYQEDQKDDLGAIEKWTDAFAKHQALISFFQSKANSAGGDDDNPDDS